MPKRQAEPRVKIEAEIKASARAALRRYCDCFDISMATFITNRAREYEGKMLARLNEAQREAYFDGDLLWDEMSHEEQEACRAPRPAILHAETDERLTWLAETTGRTKTNIVEILVRGAFQRFGPGKPPPGEPVPAPEVEPEPEPESEAITDAATPEVAPAQAA
jgi:hypothetical protein